MNIHEEVARQRAVESAEALGRGEVFDVEGLVKSQLAMFDAMGKAAIRSAKLSGECMRCQAPIPIGGRLCRDGVHTTALCEPCGEYAEGLINNCLAKKRANKL